MSCLATDPHLETLNTYCTLVKENKGKFHPRTGHEGTEGSTWTPLLFSNLGQDGGCWSTPCPGSFTPDDDEVYIVREAGWAPGSVWTSTANLAPTGIRPHDRPARSAVATPTALSRPTPYFCNFPIFFFDFLLSS